MIKEGERETLIKRGRNGDIDKKRRRRRYQFKEGQTEILIERGGMETVIKTEGDGNTNK